MGRLAWDLVDATMFRNVFGVCVFCSCKMACRLGLGGFMELYGGLYVKA